MTGQNPQPAQDVYDFIQANIDSVPHLETVILLWNCRPAPCSPEELAARLYISADKVNKLLRDLIRLQLVQVAEGSPAGYAYYSSSASQDDLIRRLESTYRHDLIRISNMIHLKASSPVREFARAFRIKKEQDQ